jgi:outer membrane protein assembly factor BamB
MMTLFRTLAAWCSATRLARGACCAALLAGTGIWGVRLQYGVSEVRDADHPRHFPLAMAPATADDWPGLRGPAGNGTVSRDGFAASPAAPSRPTWQAALPGGPRGGPCVRAGRVFVPVVEPEQRTIALWAFDRDDGRLAWKSVLHRDVSLERSSSPGSAAPASDGQSVFLGAAVEGRLLVSSVDLDGRLRWTCDAGPLRAENGRLVSPLLSDSLVIVPGEHRGTQWNRWLSTGHLTAIHRQTGEIVWRIRRPNVELPTTPALAAVGGRRQLILAAPSRICGYDPANGELVWSCRWDATRAADALAWDERTIFAAAREPRAQIVAVRIDEEGKPQLLWQSDAAAGATIALHRDGDGVLAFNDAGQLTLLNPETGKVQWRRQLPGDYVAAPLFAGRHLFCVSFRGIGSVVDLRQRGKSVSEQTLCDGAVAPLAATSRHVFLRTPSSLLCLPWDESDSPLVNAPGKPRKHL